MRTIEQLREELKEEQNMIQKINEIIEEAKSYINYDFVAYDTRITKFIAFRRSEFSKIKKIFSFNDTFSMIHSANNKNIEDILKMDAKEIYLTNEEKEKIIFNYINSKEDAKNIINKSIEELQNKINNYDKYADFEKLKEDYKRQYQYFDSLVGQGIYTFSDGGFWKNGFKANPTITSNNLTKTLYIYAQRCCTLDFKTGALIFYEMNHSTTVVKYINKFLEDSGINIKFSKINYGDEIKTDYRTWKTYYHKYYYNENYLKAEDIISEVIEYINK